jgi:hypothetical protein
MPLTHNLRAAVAISLNTSAFDITIWSIGLSRLRFAPDRT